MIASASALAPALALADELSIEGITLQSTNHGSVTAAGGFGEAIIGGGRDNRIGVTAVGAAISVDVLDDGGSNGNTLSVRSVNASATNDGNVTATGTFNGSSISADGTRNSQSVLAVGASVSISVTKR
jgi:hypothetical protein